MNIIQILLVIALVAITLYIVYAGFTYWRRAKLISTENTEIRLPQARHAIGFLLLWLVVGCLGSLAVIVLLDGVLRIPRDTQAFGAFSIVMESLITIWLIWLFMRRRRFDWRATMSLRPCRPSVYFWAVVSVVPLSMVLGQLASYLLQLMPWLMPESLSKYLLDLVRMSRFGDPGVYVLFALAISLGPGLTEELVFRGFILRGLSARFSPIGAVTLTAFLFALLHAVPLSILVTFPAGLYLGYLVVRTRSLYPAIVAHAFNNLWSTLEASLWQAYNPQVDVKELVMNWTYPPVVIGLAAVLLAVGLYALHRVTRLSTNQGTN